MKRLPAAVLVLLLALFVTLGFVVHRYQILDGERAVMDLTAGIEFPLFTPTMKAMSYLGTAIAATVTVGAALAVLLLMRRRAEAALTGATLLLGWLLGLLFKVLVDRARPGADLLTSDTSFPSGHATYATVLGGIAFYLAPRLLHSRPAAGVVQVIAVLFVALMGLSRIALEAHWPSDVLGGFMLGVILLVPALSVYNGRLRGAPDVHEVEDA